MSNHSVLYSTLQRIVGVERCFAAMSDVRYMNKHRALGLCTECCESAIPGYALCAFHLIKRRENKKRFRHRHRLELLKKTQDTRKRFKEEGRCPTCGGPNDGPTVKCARCLEWRTGLLPKGAYKYGTYQQDSSG